MTQTCHPIPQAVAHDMLRGLVETICDRPGQTKAQRDARSTSVVHAVLAFQPRDPVELMFAGMAVTHYHLILHSAHEAFGEQPEGLKPRTRSGIVALDRAMTGFVKELHTAKKRPLEGAAEVAVKAEPVPEPTIKGQPPVVTERRAEPAVSPRDVEPSTDATLVTAMPRGGASATAMMAVLTPQTRPMLASGRLKQANGARCAPAVGGPGACADDIPGSSLTSRTRAAGVLPGLPGGV